MANYWFLYDNVTGNIQGSPYLGSATTWTNVPAGQSAFGPFDQSTASATVQDAYAHPERYYVQNNALVQKSYLTLASVLSQTTANEYTVTATLNNPPATPPISVTFTIAGATFTATLTNNQASIVIDLHKVVAGQAIAVQVSATGCVDGKLNIGGTAAASANLKAVTQTSGNILVKNTSKSEITAYYFAHNISQADMLTDLANLADLHSSIIMKLAATAPAGTFTAAEQTALNDITTNLVPKLRLTLTDATMTSTNTRYPQIVNQKGQANSNADEYLQVTADPDVH